MKRVEDQLRERIGLDAASVGSPLIQRAIRQRMRSLGLKGLEDYHRLLSRSHAEFNQLVEAVVITETWFFRDPETFSALARLVREQWLPAGTADPLRLLSVPCASGEEPFSLGMALLDAGVPAERFRIEAVDISAHALARARQGIYGKNSFRGKDLAFRDRYFRRCEAGYALDPVLRDCVQFSHGNILSADFLTGRAGYDVIFCRNLLIYFDPLMRGKALDQIELLLAPAGALFVGPVEQPLAIAHGFVTAKTCLGFALLKPSPSARRQRAAGMSKRPGAATRSLPKGEGQTELQANGDLGLCPPGNPSCALPADLEKARRLADAGLLREATEICEAHLRRSRVSAQAYYLLGLVREAGGEAGAIDCYRKALYLEPNHYESLLHMALLLQKSGEAGRARALKERAQRIRLKT